MLKYILICFVLFSVNTTWAQQADSLSAVSFFGTIYAVKQGEAITLHQLKNIVKSDPEAFAAFKKARRIQWTYIGLTTLGVVSLVVGISATYENPTLYWGGIIGAGALFGTSFVIQEGPYSRYVLQTINLHNRKFQPKP
jgi:hypothetical protein